MGMQSGGNVNAIEIIDEMALIVHPRNYDIGETSMMVGEMLKLARERKRLIHAVFHAYFPTGSLRAFYRRLMKSTSGVFPLLS